MFSPFTGLLLDPDHVRDVGLATSPPYDVISPDEREGLVSSSPYNVVRVLLAGPDDPDYRAARETLASWRREGALIADTGDHFYLYLMDYVTPEGTERTVRGVLGAMDLVEPGDRVVPHEETRAKHRADRMAAMTATETNVDVIIGLSSSPDLSDLLWPETDPLIDFIATDDVRHRLWRLGDPHTIAAIRRAVDGHSIAIADGHHRYLTALEYRSQQHGPGPWDAILAYVTPAEGGGLTVGPYHRVFREFDFDPVRVADAFKVIESPAVAPREPGSLVIATTQGAWRLDPRPAALSDLPGPWREASPAVAREVLYPRLGVDEADAEYVPDAAVALGLVPDGGAAVLVAPVSEAAIAAAGEKGLRFPSKTTFFVPKPRAGLVMRSIAG